MRKVKILAAVVSSAMLIAVTTSHAQNNFPARPVTMIVPFPAGGPSDTVARIMAEGMGKSLGETVIVENVNGAGGTLGASRAAAAAPDGYTILAVSMGSHVAAPAFYPNLKYDPRKDFESIGLTANAPAAIAVRKDFPASNLKEFVAEVQKRGGDVKQAHGGIGATSHMACLLFNEIFGLKPTPVAYRGTGPAVNDLIGGHIDYYCEQAVSVASAAKGKLIKVLMVSGDKRLDALPDVASAKEAGAPDYQLNIWSAIFAPKGTPKDILAKLGAALDKTLDDPSTAKRLAELGATVPTKSERGSDALVKLVSSDIDRFGPILKKAAATTVPAQ